MVLPCCVAAGAQSGSTLLAMTWQIATPAVRSATGTRKNSSAALARVATSQMAGKSPTARRLHRTTWAERQVRTTTNRRAILDKPRMAKTILFILTCPDCRTHNTRLSRSRITSLSNADSRVPIRHRRTRRRCLKHQRTPNLPMVHMARLPSCRSTRLHRRVQFCISCAFQMTKGKELLICFSFPG